MAYYRPYGRRYGRRPYPSRRPYGAPRRRSYGPPRRSSWARPRRFYRRATPALVIEQAPSYGNLIPKSLKGGKR